MSCRLENIKIQMTQYAALTKLECKVKKQRKLLKTYFNFCNCKNLFGSFIGAAEVVICASEVQHNRNMQSCVFGGHAFEDRDFC